MFLIVLYFRRDLARPGPYFYKKVTQHLHWLSTAASAFILKLSSIGIKN